MTMDELYSKVFLKRWQVEKVLSEKPLPGGNASLTMLEVVVHDINNPAIKYTARVGGDVDSPLEEWKFNLDIPINE